MSFSDKFTSYKKALPAGVLLPQVKIDERLYKKFNCSSDLSNHDFLRQLCMHGVKEMGIDKLPNKQVYYDRLKRELDLFKELGFTDYILLTWDILHYCREQDIPVGAGRGSACGCAVLYCIGVTNIDPVKHNLYFERFVSKARARKFEQDGVTYLDGSLMVDVDNDIAYEDRQRVIDYIYSKYPEKVAAIMTFTTLSGKLCIKECIKIIEEGTEENANHVSDMIPKVFGKVLDFDKAIESNEKFKNWAKEHKETLDIARQLEGLIKNSSVHPSGIAISNGKIGELAPISFDGNHPVASYDMDSVSELMVKVDILGLRTLSVVHNCCKMLGIDWKKINLEDESVFAPFQDLKSPKGIFQIEADTNLEVCRKIRPKNLNELSDVLALARPGALAFVDEYVAVKNGEKEAEKRLPELDKILGETKNIFIYQESLMRVASEVFGLSLEDAEAIRRACGKKKREEMQKWESRIYEQAKLRKIDISIADFYWKALNDSADYSFNRSHSIAYASLAAITTYLKFNHPREFFCSLLNMSKHEQTPHEEIRVIASELKDFGIQLLPPDLGKSKMDFTIEDGNIRYGLSSIKGVSTKTFEALESFRGKEKPNKFQIFQAAKQAGINIGVLSALIQAGTLEGYKQKRSRTVLEAQAWNVLTDREKRNYLVLGREYDYNLVDCIKKSVELGTIADDNKKIMTPKRYETFKKKIDKYQKIYSQNSKYESFANWYFENQLLGYCSNLKLKDIMGEDFCDSSDFEYIERGKRKFIGTVLESKKAKSKAGNAYISVQISDESGKYSAILCDSKKSAKCTEYIAANKPIPEKGDIVKVLGSLADDKRSVFADDFSILSQVIYLKLGDLKDEDDSDVIEKPLTN